MFSNVNEKNAESCVSAFLADQRFAHTKPPIQPLCNKAITPKDQTTVISGKTWHKARGCEFVLSPE